MTQKRFRLQPGFASLAISLKPFAIPLACHDSTLCLSFSPRQIAPDPHPAHFSWHRPDETRNGERNQSSLSMRAWNSEPVAHLSFRAAGIAPPVVYASSLTSGGTENKHHYPRFGHSHLYPCNDLTATCGMNANTDLRFGDQALPADRTDQETKPRQFPDHIKQSNSHSQCGDSDVGDHGSHQNHMKNASSRRMQSDAQPSPVSPRIRRPRFPRRRRPPSRELVKPMEPSASYALRLVDATEKNPLHPVLQLLQLRSQNSRLRDIHRQQRHRASRISSQGNGPIVPCTHSKKSKVDDCAIHPTPKLALCIEGGGMRGAISAGMVAAIKYCGLEDCFDAVYGCSAGAIIGAYFVSRQLPVYGAQIYYHVLCGPITAVDHVLGTDSRTGSQVTEELVSAENIGKALDTQCENRDALSVQCCENSITQQSPLNITTSSLDVQTSYLHSESSNDRGDRHSNVPARLGRFIDLRALIHHPYFRRLRGMRPTNFYTPKSRPVLHLDYLLNAVVRNQRPLDWKTFSRVGKVQPLRPVASSLTSLKSEVLNFETLDELLECLRASARVPGIAGNPVAIGDDLYCDGVMCEPIPFRSAIKEGCTHVLVLRSKPDSSALNGKGPKSPGVYEKHIARPYFSLQDQPAESAAEFIRRGGHLKVYRADVETLVQANRSPEENGPFVFSIVPPSSSEIGQLESRPEAIFEGVRAGFAAAYEALSPFATESSEYAQNGPLLGDQAARFVFSDLELAETKKRLEYERRAARRRRKKDLSDELVC